MGKNSAYGKNLIVRKKALSRIAGGYSRKRDITAEERKGIQKWQLDACRAQKHELSLPLKVHRRKSRKEEREGRLGGQETQEG